MISSPVYYSAYTFWSCAVASERKGGNIVTRRPIWVYTKQGIFVGADVFVLTYSCVQLTYAVRRPRLAVFHGCRCCNNAALGGNIDERPVIDAVPIPTPRTA
jgi:hypothetical protein